MPIRSPALVALLVLAAASIAQERRHALGRVLGPDGKPLAAATVTLTCQLAPDDALASPEVVTATTGDDGTFRAALRVGRHYAAGAVGADANGRAAVSQIVNAIGAAQFVTLHASSVVAPTRVHIGGLAAWGNAAPRRGRFTCRHAPGIAVEFAIAAAGAAELPLLPRDAGVLELLGADGSTVWWDSVQPPDAELEVTLGAPLDLRFVARDGKGQPVGGALIEQRSATVWFGHLGVFETFRTHRWRSLGTTGADGTLRARVATPPEEEWVRVFRASKPGLAAGISGYIAEHLADARRQDDADRGELHFELADEQPLRGSVETKPGEPLAGADLFVEVIYMMPMANGGSVHVPLLYPVRTDAHGGYEVRGAPMAGLAPRLLAKPSLSGPGGAQLPAMLARIDVRAEPAVTRLSALRTVEVQGLLPDGGPAEGATAVLVSLADRHWFVEAWDARYRLDRAGRATLCAPSGEHLLFCSDGAVWASTVIDDQTENVELRFVPLASATIRCVAADGKPAAGAEVTIHSHSPATQGEPVDLARSAVAVSLHQGLFANVTTDGEGIARVRLLLLPNSATMQLEVSHRGAKSEPIAFGGGEVTVTLPAPARGDGR
ncbi:MAG TPA: hypothetical protein VFD82_05110 [Planctomycetota bacterium]|nr:hypothetical protein [Planctomycetota bacterium]